MDTVTLGRTGLEVSPIAFGTSDQLPYASEHDIGVLVYGPQSVDLAPAQLAT